MQALGELATMVNGHRRSVSDLPRIARSNSSTPTWRPVCCPSSFAAYWAITGALCRPTDGTYWSSSR